MYVRSLFVGSGRDVRPDGARELVRASFSVSWLALDSFATVVWPKTCVIAAQAHVSWQKESRCRAGQHKDSKRHGKMRTKYSLGVHVPNELCKLYPQCQGASDFNIQGGSPASTQRQSVIYGMEAKVTGAVRGFLPFAGNPCRGLEVCLLAG